MIIYGNINYIKEEKLEDSRYYIYVIENSNQLIKIGITTDIKQRINSLSGSNGGGEKIIKIAVSSPTYLKTIEKTVHTYFNKYRIPNTEWFKDILFEDVVDYIDSIFTSQNYNMLNNLRKNYGYTTKYHKGSQC